MAPKSKSLFRQPGAQHFQLVHRSQRDPLIHDPEASRHVLKPFERENTKKGKSRTDLESVIPSSDLENPIPVGEAALYGIYYDDTEYNYMQHLRPVGLQEEGVDSVLIEAPIRKSKLSKQSVHLRDIPAEALPSTSEIPRDYVLEMQEAVPSSIAGFQPDMDSHLRQVLEALDDDAFVDDDLEDDFFGELVKDGERGSDEQLDFENEEDLDDGGESLKNQGEGWEARFAQYKREQKVGRTGDDEDSVDPDSEGGDTIGRLPEMSVIGGKGKKRRRGTSEASGYSMSSSSMYRNEALQTLDERFDQMILKEYDSDPESNSDDDDNSDGHSASSSSSAPELITTREDFESMMDDFLDNYEILGRKMKPKVAGETGVDKLDTIRRAMGSDEHVRLEFDNEGDEEENDMLMPIEVEDKKDRWDCETILTTYSNLENHPRLIRARDIKPVSQIQLDRRTGLPVVIVGSKSSNTNSKLGSIHTIQTVSEDEEDSDLEGLPHITTIVRSRTESKEDRKVRKVAVKAERQARRINKKLTKEQFSSELKLQMKGIVNKEKAKTRKL